MNDREGNGPVRDILDYRSRIRMDRWIAPALYFCTQRSVKDRRLGVDCGKFGSAWVRSLMDERPRTFNDPVFQMWGSRRSENLRSLVLRLTSISRGAALDRSRLNVAKDLLLLDIKVQILGAETRDLHQYR